MKVLSSPLHVLQKAAQRGEQLFARRMADSNLSLRQLIVLEAVLDSEGLSQTDIMRATGIDRSSTAELVARSGLIGSRATSAIQTRQTRVHRPTHAARSGNNPDRQNRVDIRHSRADVGG